MGAFPVASRDEYVYAQEILNVTPEEFVSNIERWKDTLQQCITVKMLDSASRSEIAE